MAFETPYPEGAITGSVLAITPGKRLATVAVTLFGAAEKAQVVVDYPPRLAALVDAACADGRVVEVVGRFVETHQYGQRSRLLLATHIGAPGIFRNLASAS